MVTSSGAASPQSRRRAPGLPVLNRSAPVASTMPAPVSSTTAGRAASAASSAAVLEVGGGAAGVHHLRPHLGAGHRLCPAHADQAYPLTGVATVGRGEGPTAALGEPGADAAGHRRGAGAPRPTASQIGSAVTQAKKRRRRQHRPTCPARRARAADPAVRGVRAGARRRASRKPLKPRRCRVLADRGAVPVRLLDRRPEGAAVVVRRVAVGPVVALPATLLADRHPTRHRVHRRAGGRPPPRRGAAPAGRRAGAAGPDEPGRAGLGRGAAGVGRAGVGDGARPARGGPGRRTSPPGVGRCAPGSALGTNRGCTGATPATLDAAGSGPGSSPTADPVGQSPRGPAPLLCPSRRSLHTAPGGETGS